MMLFDHDSARRQASLRNRAEEQTSKRNSQQANDLHINISSPGSVPPGTQPQSTASGSQPLSNASGPQHQPKSPVAQNGNTPKTPAGKKPADKPGTPNAPAKFAITSEEIAALDHNVENLGKYGGVQGILRILKVDPKKGLEGNLDDSVARAQQFGENTYPVSKPRPYWRYVWEAVQDPTILILIGCATASLAVGLSTEDPRTGWFDGGGICFAILLVLLVSSTSNYRQSLQFRALTAENQKIMVNVTRGGKRTKVIIFELLVGDIVHLGIGDQIPGDGLLLSTSTLVVDESSMTGESEPANKDSRRPFLISGCKVMDGTGTQLITAVGMHTEWGKVMATLAVDNDEETPLQIRLNHLAETIGKVTIVVVAVPEGLPLAVTITLAYSMHKMMDDRALVRNLSACETMGSATTICSDKTGTLTMNLMTVVSSWVSGNLRSPTELDNEIKQDVLTRIFEGVCLNSTGSVGVSPEGVVEVIGSPTEVACINWSLKLGAVFDDVQRDNVVLAIDSFNSAKKRMGVIIQVKGGNYWVHWKGASEMLLARCSRFIDADGSIQDLTNEKRDKLEGIITTFANAALRTLCFACKELSEQEVAKATENKAKPEIPDDGLICVAIIGIKDPLRPGVVEAVKRCQHAGIKVRMVTGDNIITAKAIATECGIYNSSGVAIEGKQFRELSVEEQYRILPTLQVMARSSPTDKHTLVKRLLEMGDVVAVTGDGTNDAPALHEASIGLAMGIAGTEVAKESADIIILDDNFASIVKVVRWGRSIYSNIQKFIQFQLTVNMVALWLNFISSIVEGRAPLTAVQLLWVNLIMDTLGALALATEPPNEALMDNVPIGEPLITNVMWRNMLGIFAYQITWLLIIQFRAKDIWHILDKPGEIPVPGVLSYSEQVVDTMIFNVFVFCQIFNEINAKKPEHLNVFAGLHKSAIFIYVFVFTTVVQIILVEYCGKFTSTVKLSWEKWLSCVAIGLFSMPLAAVIKLIPTPKKHFLRNWQEFKRLKFRGKGSVKILMVSGSQKKMMADIAAAQTMKAKKFYSDFEMDGTSPSKPQLDSNFSKSRRAIVPTVGNYQQTPNNGNNSAWQ